MRSRDELRRSLKEMHRELLAELAKPRLSNDSKVRLARLAEQCVELLSLVSGDDESTVKPSLLSRIWHFSAEVAAFVSVAT